MDPGFYLARVWLGITYHLVGHVEKAWGLLREVAETEVDIPYALGFLGWGLAIAGHREEALSTLEKLEDFSSGQYVPPFQKGNILAGLGRLDEAFELFEESYRLRSPQLVLWNTIPTLDHVRSDPRFRSLLRRVGFEVD
jgi:tetratricopeptide (TPR) repeat protein